MRTLLTLLTVAAVFFPLGAYGTIINIPNDYPTIQEGIDHSSDGDTVLVDPGTYGENVNFNGHNITLASLFLITGDTSYISSTIIDGSQDSSVIIFESGEDSTAQIAGFTIKNGNATEGGGIHCADSDPVISSNTITSNYGVAGGGIHCLRSDPTIRNNTINDNEALLYGGAICCSGSSPMIINNSISGNNSREMAGGIFCGDGGPTVIGNTIADNVAWWIGGWGGGIVCESPNTTISNNLIDGNMAMDYGMGGGIYCTGDCTISSNTISHNSDLQGGGGICCENCSPSISNNLITGNSSHDGGGGIGCYGSSPVISDNSIIRNESDFGGGGGLRLVNSDPIIAGNLISLGSALWGGGVYCYESNPTITGNNISGNSACWFEVSDGGGVFCCYSSPVISRNSITGNSAIGGLHGRGGGIYCEGSGPTILNNSIAGNWASAEYGDGDGGGICCVSSSDPTILNTILWRDSAANGPEIYAESGSNPAVTYCDVQGGWPGTGNIDADPMFVGPHNHDLHLRWHSPCIDAGDPDPQYNDPDLTRSDIGVFYFNQSVLGVVEVYPHEEPIVIPPEGGQVVYDGWVFNFIGHPGRGDIWTYAFVPGVGRYGPIDLYRNLSIPPDSVGMNNIRQNVPGFAPAGDYVFAAYVGSYPNTIVDSSYFYFSKEGSAAGEIGDWSSGGLLMKAGDETAFNLPSHCGLSQNYPNPFNAVTTIDYQLPGDAEVKLEVYNTLGQKVATLVDERQEAGYRSVVWNASEISSGLYFYKLTAGEFTETRRMMLVK
jgi:hypothetical protein